MWTSNESKTDSGSCLGLEWVKVEFGFENIGPKPIPFFNPNPNHLDLTAVNKTIIREVERPSICYLI